MRPKPDRERTPPQQLTHPGGKTPHLSYLRADGSQLATTSQRCFQNDEIVVIAQVCFEPFQVGNQRSLTRDQRIDSRS